MVFGSWFYRLPLSLSLHISSVRAAALCIDTFHTFLVLYHSAAALCTPSFTERENEAIQINVNWEHILIQIMTTNLLYSVDIQLWNFHYWSGGGGWILQIFLFKFIREFFMILNLIFKFLKYFQKEIWITFWKFLNLSIDYWTFKKNYFSLGPKKAITQSSH